MLMIKDFYDLNAWKESHKLTCLIYRLVKNFPDYERYGITDQLRRASSSVTANIAEGCGRNTNKDKKNFFYLARGSIKEVQSFLILAKDLDYITPQNFNDYWKQSKISEMLISGLIRSLSRQSK